MEAGMSQSEEVEADWDEPLQAVGASIVSDYYDSPTSIEVDSYMDDPNADVCLTISINPATSVNIDMTHTEAVELAQELEAAAAESQRSESA
jgi:hypothetical protein